MELGIWSFSGAWQLRDATSPLPADCACRSASPDLRLRRRVENRRSKIRFLSFLPISFLIPTLHSSQVTGHRSHVTRHWRVRAPKLYEKIHHHIVRLFHCARGRHSDRTSAVPKYQNTQGQGHGAEAARGYSPERDD